MSDDPAFDALVERLRGGDEDAARECYERFRRPVTAQINRRLAAAGGRFRWRIDPADVWQDAFLAFVVGLQKPGGFQVESERKCFNLLLTIAINRLGHAIDYWRAAARDLERVSETPVEWLGVVDKNGAASRRMRLIECVRSAVARLDPAQRALVEHRLNGNSWSRQASEEHTGRKRSEKGTFCFFSSGSRTHQFARPPNQDINKVECPLCPSEPPAGRRPSAGRRARG